MTITLDLTPDIEQGLLVQAQAKGLSIIDYVEELVEQQARLAAPGPRPTPGSQGRTLHEFFMHSPLRGANLDLERAQDYPRTLDIE